VLVARQRVTCHRRPRPRTVCPFGDQPLSLPHLSDDLLRRVCLP